MTREAAAPYAETTVGRVRYSASSALPVVRNSDATAAPIHTSLQATSVSGRYLKIIPSSSVIAQNETRTLTDSRKMGPGSRSPMELPAACSAALPTSDTSNRKPVAKTRPNDKKRSRITPSQTLPDLRGTFQILLSASWSSTKAPDAPA